MNITSDKQKRALLLYQAGPATEEIFDIVSDTGDDYKAAQAKLDEYFAPKKNVDYEVFSFDNQYNNQTKWLINLPFDYDG